MINIKELNIGNYLRVAKEGLCIKKGTIIKINGIDAENKFMEKGLVGVISCHPLDKYQFDGGIWLAYLEPIEITPEILEKNGIKKEYNILYDDFYHNDDVSVTKVVDEWFVRIGATNSLYVKYLHQLQNALTLCGTNKEIELL